MARVQITWQRTCEYVAAVDTAELREIVARLQGSTHDIALYILDNFGDLEPHDQAQLGWIISNTETGREYLGGLADDNPDLLGGTGVPEITDIRPSNL